MNRVLGVSVGALAAVLCVPGLALADNCGSISDCWGTAAAAAAAAAGAGALAAAAAGSGKDDDCEAERDWLEACKAQDNLLRQLCDDTAAQLQSLRMQAYALIQQAIAEAASAPPEMLGLVTSVTSLLTPLSSMPDVTPGEDTRMANTSFFQALQAYLTGPGAMLQDPQTAGPVLFTTMLLLQQLSANATSVAATIQMLQQQLGEAEAELARAQDALDQCEMGVT